VIPLLLEGFRGQIISEETAKAKKGYISWIRTEACVTIKGPR